MKAEAKRLEDARNKRAHWRRRGPYLADRQWGTVREDYSAHGTAWDSFPHDHARSRAYRWGEDGILGISDNHQRLCFALALWNERDPILKERYFGLTGPEGNHGEDVKEYSSTSTRRRLTRTCAACTSTGRRHIRTGPWWRRTGAGGVATPSSSCSRPAPSTRAATGTWPSSTRRRARTTS